jgi:hypothetical protein
VAPTGLLAQKPQLNFHYVEIGDVLHDIIALLKRARAFFIYAQDIAFSLTNNNLDYNRKPV